MTEENKLMPIQDMIYEVREQKVMLDSDLAALYEVPTHRLNEAVKRNIKRFPLDFMFQLTGEEWGILRSQIVTSRKDASNLISQNAISSLRSQNVTSEEDISILKYQTGTSSWGGKRKLPYVFTEQGIAMLSGLLNSDIAIKVNIEIMRAFIKLRHYALSQNISNEQIAELRKLLMLHIENNEQRLSEHDEAINKIIRVLNNLIEKPKPARRIGFISD